MKNFQTINLRSYKDSGKMNFALNYEIMYDNKKNQAELLCENIKLHDSKIYVCVEDGHSSMQAVVVSLKEYI